MMEELDAILHILENGIRSNGAECKEQRTPKLLDRVDEKVDLTWQAVMEIQKKLTDHSLKIKSMDKNEGIVILENSISYELRIRVLSIVSWTVLFVFFVVSDLILKYPGSWKGYCLSAEKY